jgi:2-polyprenyl-6-methoxyphenol hydroxylase-like FAD-dependent oxidoreductase
MVDLVRPFPDPVPRIAAALAEPSALYHPPMEEVRLQRWSQQRILLIGDAAHATAPVWAEGAALAVEDALVLADRLTNSDWAEVGAEYQRLRQPRIRHVQTLTDRASRIAGLPGWLRDAIAPVAGPRSYRDAYGPLRQPVV